jgi:DNA-binding GntR family transcriptional regulator
MSMQSLIDSRPLHHRVYDVLIDRVITGELVAGDRLDAAELAQALGVSRTPVKEALNRLASEGIVDIQARRGTSVKVPTQAEVSELYEIMRMIGLYVAEPAIRRATPDDTQALRELLAAIELEITDGVITDYAAYLERDRAFHTCMVQLAGNSRLLEMYRIAGLQIRLAYSPETHGHHDVSLSATQHRAIIRAFEERSVEGLHQAMAEHYAAPALLGQTEGSIKEG